MPTSPANQNHVLAFGQFNYFPNAVTAFRVLADNGIYMLGGMRIDGDFGQHDDPEHPEGCAGMGIAEGPGPVFHFYNDGRVAVFLPAAE